MPEPSPLTEPLRWVLTTAEATRDLGRSLGRVLGAGDVLLLTGDLGAGKTTLTQGLAEGLDVRGPVTSPTFVIARVHPSLVGGPALVHVDAYRLGGGLELDDLDLDAAVEDSVTVVEWGHGVAELLTGDRLELVLDTAPPTADRAPDHDPSAGARHATLTATGPRWTSPAAQALLRAELRAELPAELRAELSTEAGPGGRRRGTDGSTDSLSDVLLLAIDTSTSAISVALRDGSSVLAEATTLDARAHAEHLAPGIQSVLREAGATPADVTDVAVGLGPGPFTGLRVGIVTGRAFALAVGAGVHGLCSLDVLAHQAVARGAVRRGELLVATDARRKEVYWARYAVDPAEPGGIRRLSGPAVTRPGDLPPELVALPTVGRGPQLYPQVWGHGSRPVSGHVSGPVSGPVSSLVSSLGADEPAYGTGLFEASALLDVLGLLDVSAAALADLVELRLASGHPVDAQEPLYLRRPDAVPSVSTKSALG